MKRKAIVSVIVWLAIILSACVQNGASAPTPNATNVRVARPSGERALPIYS